MSEREKIEAALKFYADDNSWPASRYPQIAALRDAARKHLETLPKPMWRVTGWLNHNGLGQQAAPFETGDHTTALDFARNYLAIGYIHVSVTQVAP